MEGGRKSNTILKVETNYRLATSGQPWHTVLLIFKTFVSQIISFLQQTFLLQCSSVKGVCTVKIKGFFRGSDEIAKQYLR